MPSVDPKTGGIRYEKVDNPRQSHWTVSVSTPLTKAGEEDLPHQGRQQTTNYPPALSDMSLPNPAPAANVVPINNSKTRFHGIGHTVGAVS